MLHAAVAPSQTRYALLRIEGERMAAGYSPTLRARRVRNELLRLRKKAGLTHEEAADRLGWSTSKISRIETGKTGSDAGTVFEMLNAYGVTGEDEMQALVQLAREAKRRGWWYTYRDLMPPWFQMYVDFEEGANHIQTYESELVPGLLQTEDYSRAVHRATLPGVDAGEIERRVAVRATRHKRLVEDGPRVWAIFSEAALHRVVGGPATTGEQLRHLLDLSARPNVTLQVLPFSAGAFAAPCPYTILGFPESVDRDVVYVEYLTGGLFVEEVDQVAGHQLAFTHLTAKALEPDMSVALIAKMVR